MMWQEIKSLFHLQQTGLSATQVCAALDAGEAMFEQRVREMGGHVR